MTIPGCMDCLYALATSGGALDTHVYACRHPEAPAMRRPDVIQGGEVITYPLCQTVRESEALCGPQGRWWTPRPPLWTRLQAWLRG